MIKKVKKILINTITIQIKTYRMQFYCIKFRILITPFTIKNFLYWLFDYKMIYFYNCQFKE